MLEASTGARNPCICPPFKMRLRIAGASNSSASIERIRVFTFCSHRIPDAAEIMLVGTPPSAGNCEQRNPMTKASVRIALSIVLFISLARA